MTRLTIADLEIERSAEGLEIEMEDGTVYVLQDPQGISVPDLLAFESLPVMVKVKAMLADGKWDEFIAHPEVDGYFFGAICKRYAQHYGVGNPGEGVASLRSVKGTARPSKRTSPKKASA